MESDNGQEGPGANVSEPEAGEDYAENRREQQRMEEAVEKRKGQDNTERGNRETTEDGANTQGGVEEVEDEDTSEESASLDPSSPTSSTPPTKPSATTSKVPSPLPSPHSTGTPFVFGAASDPGSGSARTQNPSEQDRSEQAQSSAQQAAATHAVPPPTVESNTKEELRLTRSSPNEPSFHDTSLEILADARIEEAIARRPAAAKALSALITSFATPKPFVDLSKSIINMVKHSGLSVKLPDNKKEDREGHAFDGNPPGSLRSLRERFLYARSLQHQEDQGWRSVCKMLTALECYLYWEETQDLLKCDPQNQDREYLERLIERNKPKRKKGRKKADDLKVAIAPFLGIHDAGNRNHWKNTMGVGKAVAVFKRDWGLLALLKPSPYVFIVPLSLPSLYLHDLPLPVQP